MEDFVLRKRKVTGTGPANFNIDRVLKNQFKMECLINDQSMSQVLETLMESYIIRSREFKHTIKTAKESEQLIGTDV